MSYRTVYILCRPRNGMQWWMERTPATGEWREASMSEYATRFETEHAAQAQAALLGSDVSVRPYDVWCQESRRTA